MNLPLSYNKDSGSEVESEDFSQSPSSIKMRTLQDIYDATKQVDQSNTVLFAFCVGEDPISFDEAHKEEKWIQAMDEEMRAIKKMTHGSSQICLHTKNQLV